MAKKIHYSAGRGMLEYLIPCGVIIHHSGMVKNAPEGFVTTKVDEVTCKTCKKWIDKRRK